MKASREFCDGVILKPIIEDATEPMIAPMRLADLEDRPWWTPIGTFSLRSVVARDPELAEFYAIIANRSSL